MYKRRLPLLALLLLVGLPLFAQNRRSRFSALVPDTVPISLSGDVQPAEAATPTEAEEVVSERTLEPILTAFERYNINSVPFADSYTWQGNLQHSLDSLSNLPLFETSQLGLYVYDVTTGEDLFAVNMRHRMRPASCEKLVTAVAALECLGGNYQLLTDLSISGEVVDGVLQGNVYVVGRMDPLLSQGDVYAMARELKAQGIDSIAGSVFTDLSFKDADDLGWGWCWDDKWGPLRVLTVDGKDRFGSEFLSDLSSVGIKLSSHDVFVSLCPSSARLLRQSGHTIDQILQRMMKESDNIFAESLFYHLAASGGARGAGRKQAVARINSVISSRLGLDPSAYQIADGSGLSLYNYVSPQLLVKLLAYAWSNETLRNHLYSALPIAGYDGTLVKRMKGTRAQGNVHAKTGTVDAVYSLAGYATNSAGHLLAFCIINQGVASARPARDYQDKVCLQLCQ